MKEQAEKKLRSWLKEATTAEQVQRDIDTISALVNLESKDLDALIDEGRVIIDEKKLATPPKKRGRPAGSGKKKASGNGE